MNEMDFRLCSRLFRSLSACLFWRSNAEVNMVGTVNRICGFNRSRNCLQNLEESSSVVNKAIVRTKYFRN